MSLAGEYSKDVQQPAEERSPRLKRHAGGRPGRLDQASACIVLEIGGPPFPRTVLTAAAETAL